MEKKKSVGVEQIPGLGVSAEVVAEAVISACSADAFAAL